MNPHRTRLVPAAALTAALLAGCGGGAGYGAPPTAGSSTTPGSSATAGGGLHPAAGSRGQVLVDGRGRTVYVLLSGSADVPCSGGCAAVWPPVRAGGQPVTAGGHPVYTYTGDTAAGQVNGDGLRSFGGVWHALAPDGTPLAAAASSSAGTGGGYGAGY